MATFTKKGMVLMASDSGKITKQDLILLAIAMQEEKKPPKPQRPKIHIGINRKLLGLTQKERDELKNE